MFSGHILAYKVGCHGLVPGYGYILASGIGAGGGGTDLGVTDLRGNNFFLKKIIPEYRIVHKRNCKGVGQQMCLAIRIVEFCLQ